MTINYTDTDKASGTLTYKGTIHSFQFKKSNTGLTIILDGKNIYTSENSGNPLFSDGLAYKSISNGKKSFTHKGLNYYYVNTFKYTSNDKNWYSSIAWGVTGFVPYWGQLASAYNLIKTILSKPAKNRWYTVKTYCTKGYKYYCFKKYTYSNSKRTKLVSKKSVYKRMF